MNQRLIFWSVFFVYLGRGLQLLFWDAPYRAMLWDQNLTGSLVSLFSNWESWVNSLSVDRNVNLVTRVQGIWFCCSAFVFLFLKKEIKYLWLTLIWLNSFQLFILSLAGFWHAHHQWPYLFEYALQIGVGPLWLMTRNQSESKWAFVTAKWLVALTFAGHGLYALGVYLTPGRFLDMVIAILPVNQSSASVLLKLAGTFDLILALVLVCFSKKLIWRFRVLLLLAGFWGLATASARWISYGELSLFFESLKMWGPQVLFRLVHGLIPLWLFFILQKDYQQTARTP